MLGLFPAGAWKPRLKLTGLRSGQTPVSALRQRFDWGTKVLVPNAPNADPDNLADTSPTDRHILMAAYAANIRVLVTRNVPDFGSKDLRRLRVSAAHPDLFMAQMVSTSQYREVLNAMAKGRSRPPNSPKGLHAALSIVHPRLFAAMKGVFPEVEAQPRQNGLPAEVFRGEQCLACGRTMSAPESRLGGVGPPVCHDRCSG